MSSSFFALPFALFLSLSAGAADKPEKFSNRPEVIDFVHEISLRHGLVADDLLSQFSNFQKNPIVLRLAEPPTAKTRSWSRYRSRFINPALGRQGIAFWQANRATLERAHALYGVPPAIIVAIIGIETGYGRLTGNFSTLEALATLAFDYPRRSDYFRSELEVFFLFCHENGVEPRLIKGSFAGAIGIPQFMPGTLRRLAVDFDGDGKIDLQKSNADAIGSVAHFLEQHGWQKDGAVAVPAYLNNPNGLDLADWMAAGVLPSLPVAELKAGGIKTKAEDDERVAFIDLPSIEAPTEYWLGFDNFYAITRYNRSIFYAMSVFQFSEALRHDFLRAP